MSSVLDWIRGKLIAPEVDNSTGRYEALYAWWAGDWHYHRAIIKQFHRERPLYKNTRQLWRQSDATVALYTQSVYSGNSLTAAAESLSDGTRGAIPIDTDLQGTAADQLRAAIEAWWKQTNYRQFMSMRPKFGAILGDVLTELVDDKASGAVWPNMVWPGYVKHLELDYAGNVKAYIIEQPVKIAAGMKFGKRIEAQEYIYRKEVNGDGIWIYHDETLISYENNPYGFVPAVWDRHEIVLGDRGMSATERTYQQAIELNSTLSHALDYQNRHFASPIGVKGTSVGSRNKLQQLLANRQSTGDPIEDAAMVAESVGLLPMSQDGKFETVQTDIGKTGTLLEFMRDSQQAEAPEGSFSQQILTMTQVTAPGVERALGPIIGRVRDARKNYDTQTVKLIQMAISMTAWRVVTNGYNPVLLANRSERYDVFKPFAPGAWNKGLLDFSIPDRPVITDTIDERIDRMLKVEQLQWESHLLSAGEPPEDVKKIVAERQAEAERQARIEEIGVMGPPDGGSGDE